jgi:hypothetical protein
MSLDISLETEARIEAKAREQGISAEDYLERLMDPPKGDRGIDILKDLGIQPPANGDALKLPVWNLGVRGGLRRVEIYDDEG